METTTRSALRALVVGATGAVGTPLVRELLASPWCTRVTTIGRRESSAWDKDSGRDKLVQRVVAMEDDGKALEDAAREPHDLAFCTLGLGQPSKVPYSEFKRVDHDCALAFARGAREGGAAELAHLSAIGADRASRIKYMKLKGEIEEELKQLVFRRLAIFRPSILVTKENRFGAVDVFNRKIFPYMSWALPRRWHEVSVDDLGRAMVRHARSEPSSSVEVLTWNEFSPFIR